ncbi:MAG: KTSC domain-containing protein [Flavobacteriales bacterium]
MKKILDSRRLLGATAKTDLKELGLLYKKLMKEHHPDRFANDEARRHEAEETSKHVIDAYHFLVSIHPETHAQSAEEFERTIATPITNWHYKSQTLHVDFGDGCAFEFYGVPQNVYNKFVNNDGNSRFARRHIFHTYIRRQVKKANEASA